MNRKIGFFWLSLFVLIGFYAFVPSSSLKEDWRNGDIVFQDSESLQSEAIKLATGSNYSHCGIVFSLNGEWMVLEAVQPVRVITLEQWIAQGTNRRYAKKRLKGHLFTDDEQDKMWAIGAGFVGLNYDIYFDWSDDKLYCSELVWKIFQSGAGIRLTEPKMLKEYNLNSKIVKDQLKLRYGADVPISRKMVSPQDIFESDLIE